MQREPTVAGKFYQAKAEQLQQQIANCYEHRLGIGTETVRVTGRLLAMIVPHAGYMFSGPVASHAYSRLSKEQPQTLMLLGPKHTGYGGKFSLSAASTWKTPLGELEVDQNLSERLLASTDCLVADNDAHLYDHALEVQLPFIQYSLPKVPKIVPLALGYASFAEVAKLAESVKKIVEPEWPENLNIICSSDFSHETPRELAYRLDAEVIEQIVNLNAKGFYDLIVEDGRSVCGLMPITLLLLLMQQRKVKASLLKYATSMDIMQHERGVGYASIIFEEPE